jgi:two-component system, NarL family, response regulator LiaR
MFIRRRFLLTPILIVEAHTLLRQALRGWLEVTFPGCQVFEAASGTEAIALTRARLPGVVLIDLTLPDMNGLEATARLEVITPQTPVVILTSCEVEKQYAQLRAKGASTFVVINRVTELRSTLATLLCPQKELVES